MSTTDQLRTPTTRTTIRTLSSAGLLRPMRPDKYLRMFLQIRRAGITATTGISLSAVRCPSRLALIDDRGSMTWRELDDSCNELAAALVASGASSGSRIGILCRNHRGFVQALAASGRIGGDAVLLNTSFAGPQLAEVVEREQVDLLIHDDEFSAMLEQFFRGRPLVRILAWVDDSHVGEWTGTTIDKLVREHQGERPPAPGRQGRIILLTSGTTGTPKGASRAGGGDIGNLVSVLDRIPWRAEETVVVAAPMFHAWGFGQLLIAGTMACTVVMTRRFDAAGTLELVYRNQASGLAVVPVMLERIMDLPDQIRRRHPLPTLRFVTLSGSRMRSGTSSAFMDEFGDTLFNSYNATEAGMISIATPLDLRAAPDTAGHPILGTEIKLLDEAGQEVAPGAVGEIYVLNATKFDGYTNGDNKTYRDGYIASGDLGFMDEDQRLYVVGRTDDMIISGGENVFPLEVEQALSMHPQVRDAVCVGVEDSDFGQRLRAWVVLEPGPTVDSDDLKAFVRTTLASYKVPRDVGFLDELPRNAAGKVVKRQLPADL